MLKLFCISFLSFLSVSSSQQGLLDCPEKKWCQKNEDCGHPLIECLKGFDEEQNEWGHCQSLWDFKRPCKSDQDCYQGSSCQTVPYEQCDTTTNPLKWILKYSRK